MAFEKIEHFESRCSKAPMIHIRTDGQIYIGANICIAYPITFQHMTADIYIDLELRQLAIFPLESTLGHFGLSKAGERSRAINCRRLINEYGIVKNEKQGCEIKTIDGKKMIVFKIKIEQAQESRE